MMKVIDGLLLVGLVTFSGMIPLLITATLRSDSAAGMSSAIDSEFIAAEKQRMDPSLDIRGHVPFLDGSHDTSPVLMSSSVATSSPSPLSPLWWVGVGAAAASSSSSSSFPLSLSLSSPSSSSSSFFCLSSIHDVVIKHTMPLAMDVVGGLLLSHWAVMGWIPLLSQLNVVLRRSKFVMTNGGMSLFPRGGTTGGLHRILWKRTTGVTKLILDRPIRPMMKQGIDLSATKLGNVIPKAFRRFPRQIRGLIRNRSRLSVASDMTHVVGGGNGDVHCFRDDNDSEGQDRDEAGPSLFCCAANGEGGAFSPMRNP